VESKRERRLIAKKAAASLHHIICKAQTTKALCSSLLLETQPDGLRKRFFSFLHLKVNALVLCHVHRQFNGSTKQASNDLYQFSFIMKFNVVKKQKDL
jgi:hypothetical protein